MLYINPRQPALLFESFWLTHITQFLAYNSEISELLGVNNLHSAMPTYYVAAKSLIFILSG